MPNDSPQTTQLHRWLELYQAGDVRARDELLRIVCNRMEHLARKMLRDFPNVGRWVQTDDVLQNALMRLLRTLKQMQPDSMRALYSIAAEHIRRELLDLARHYCGPEGIGANHQSKGAEEDPRRPGCWEPICVEEPPEEMEKWCLFHQAVEQLPAEQREVVSLIYYHGWTQPEVAELFQVTDRTIRRRWQEALLTLRETMRGHMPTS